VHNPSPQLVTIIITGGVDNDEDDYNHKNLTPLTLTHTRGTSNFSVTNFRTAPISSSISVQQQAIPQGNIKVSKM
jgi:hypothetical protein